MEGVGLIVIGLGIAAFGYFLDRGLGSLSFAIGGAAQRIAEEMRFRTRVAGHFETPPTPPPPPVDERAQTMESWLSKQSFPQEMKDDLLGQWEAVAGIRPASLEEVAAWRRRLHSFGAPLPS